jgi:hypothetical protein
LTAEFLLGDEPLERREAVLVSRSRLLLVATPVWLFMDVLYVWVQDRFFFWRMFPGYEQYKKKTPVLIPTPTSIVRRW